MSHHARSTGIGSLPPTVSRGTRTAFRRVQLRQAQQAPLVQLTAIAPTLALDQASRTITGTITVYDTPSTSQGIVIHDGALTAREPLTRVKLLRDHDQRDPVGYATAVDLSAGARSATFHVPEGENGDKALQEAADHLRDGLSVGFAVKQYAFDDDFNLHVYEGELYEVSLCAIPDFADAQVDSVAAAARSQERGALMNRAQLAAALAAGTITQETHDAQLALIDQQEQQTAAQLAAAPNGSHQPPAIPPSAQPVPRVPAELSAGPVVIPPSAPAAQVRDRAIGLQQVVRSVSAAFASGDPTQIQLAIADVIPSYANPANGADPAQAWDREDWLGQVWRASDTERRWINAIGAPEDLKARRFSGWAWDVRPTPGLYDGEKGQIPTNAPKTKLIGPFMSQRWAGGWDIDRAFVDFSDEEYLTEFWNAAVDQYMLDSDSWVATRVQALAFQRTAFTLGTSITAMLKGAIADGRAVRGGKINRIFLGSTLYSEFQDIPADTLPLWLSKAEVGIAPADGGGNVGQLIIQEDTSLANTAMCYFDNRAIKVKEKRIPQLKAYDVAHAGVDLGFYSYGGVLVSDERLVLKRSRATS